MQPWQQARLEVLTRARNVQQHVRDQMVGSFNHTEISKDVASITALDYEGTAMLRVYTDLVYERLVTEDFRERLGVILVHGLVGLTQHAWLCVEGDVAKVNPDGERTAKLEKVTHISSVGVLRWRVIIDLAAIEIEPSILLLAPTSPLVPQYVEQERFTAPIDYSEALAKVSKEGVADATQEERIFTALINKNACRVGRGILEE